MSGKCGERKCKHSHVQSEGVYPEWPSYISKSPKKGSMGLTRCGEYARIKEQFLNLKVKEKAIEAFLGYQERNDNGLVLDPWLNRWPQGQWTGSMCGLNRDGFEEYTSGTPGRNGLAANLPTCFWKTGNLHAEHSATWTRERVAVRRSREGFLATRPARKLNGESLAFEVTAVEGGHNISGIQLVIVFDEAETVHQFDLRNLTGAMAAEMFLDVAFGHIAGKIPKIKAG